jgi:hypothetical protein
MIRILGSTSVTLQLRDRARFDPRARPMTPATAVVAGNTTRHVTGCPVGDSSMA